MEKSGIYLIKSTINSKKYVGSAVNLKHRKATHLSCLKNNNHGNIHLQRHFNKHGNIFEFVVLEYCKKDKLIEREQYYIDTLTPEFNICKTAGSCLGKKHSTEARKKMSDSTRGENNPFYGKIRTDEVKRKISKSLTGKNNIYYGKKFSEDHKRKIGDAHRGMKRPESGKKKMSEARKTWWAWKKKLDVILMAPNLYKL